MVSIEKSREFSLNFTFLFWRETWMPPCRSIGISFPFFVYYYNLRLFNAFPPHPLPSLFCLLSCSHRSLGPSFTHSDHITKNIKKKQQTWIVSHFKTTYHWANSLFVYRARPIIPRLWVLRSFPFCGSSWGSFKGNERKEKTGEKKKTLGEALLRGTSS